MIKIRQITWKQREILLIITINYYGIPNYDIEGKILRLERAMAQERAIPIVV
jgi:hypothetical protein